LYFCPLKSLCNPTKIHDVNQSFCTPIKIHDSNQIHSFQVWSTLPLCIFVCNDLCTNLLCPNCSMSAILTTHFYSCSKHWFWSGSDKHSCQGWCDLSHLLRKFKSAGWKKTFNSDKWWFAENPRKEYVNLCKCRVLTADGNIIKVQNLRGSLEQISLYHNGQA